MILSGLDDLSWWTIEFLAFSLLSYYHIVLYLICNHFCNEVRQEAGLEVVLSVKGTEEMKSEVIDLNYCFIYCLTPGKYPGLNLLICKMR